MVGSPESDLEDLLNWLCWYYAVQGMDNYHPTLEAAKCMSSVEEQYRDRPRVRLRMMQYEKGQHMEKMVQAEQFIKNIENMGYEPKERAESYHSKVQEEGEIRDLTWEWYDEPKRVWEKS